MKKQNIISQADNYASNFGEVTRASAIFWVKNDDKIKTVISLSNYWQFKNKVKVKIIINLRNIFGALISREIIDLDRANVYNYEPLANFEGSVEVEVFSAENLKIPYAAVMAIYESSKSISMVHSYARAYSQHEIEDKRIIEDGEESCWTLREDGFNSSFAIIHNGPQKHVSQLVTLTVQNWLGIKKTAQFELPEIHPFQTIYFEPSKYFFSLSDFLEGEPGNAHISFKLNGGFPRMLCGIKTNDFSQLQLTHSNFNYSIHSTDSITTGIMRAYMKIPNIVGDYVSEIVIYPDADKGVYLVECDGIIENFKNGDLFKLKFKNAEAKSINFVRRDNVLPTRIVTGLRLYSKKDIVPAECSLGVIHHNRPQKNFHWMIVSYKFKSQICWIDFHEVYGGCPDDAEFIFKLYSAENLDVTEKKFIKINLPSNNTLIINSIFENKISNQDYSYLGIWCSYGGLMFFSTLEKNSSITIEHSF